MDISKSYLKFRIIASFILCILTWAQASAQESTKYLTNTYVGAGTLFGATDISNTSKPTIGIGATIGRHYNNLNVEGSIHYGYIHFRDYNPDQQVCRFSYTLAGGYTLPFGKRFTVTPMLGLQWHTGAKIECDNPTFIGAMRAQYSFSRHWGIAYTLESDFLDNITDRLHIVYTF